MEKVFASVRFSSPLSVAVARTSQSPFPLCDTLFEQSYQNQQTKERWTKLPTLQKNKRGATQHTKPTHCTTFVFSRPNREQNAEMILKEHFATYNLTSGQSLLLDELDKFLSDNSTCFILKGYAGTGKTFMMKGLTLSLIHI